MTTETPAKVTATTLPDEPYKHVRAAFINAIAEEGTKAEAIDWLQRTWNECCALRQEFEALLQSFNAERLRAEAMAKDAGRYRWLRGWNTAINAEFGPWCVQWTDESRNETVPICEEELDTAIDTAIEQGAQHG